MDQNDSNESTVPMSVSYSRPNSPSPVTETVEAAAATVEEEIKGGDSLAKRKRGRPRKYDSTGKLIKPSGVMEESTFSSSRKMRGDLCMSIGGEDFRPHIFTIDTQEEIIESIMSFTQNGTRGICVLSANGAVSNVKIKPLGFNSKVLTFEGAYEILSLSGSMVIAENGEVRNESWRISIGGVDGCVIGGTLVGGLIAASPVQIVIGSFLPLVTNPAQERNYVSESVIVTQEIPNSLACTSVGQDQQPDMENLLTV